MFKKQISYNIYVPPAYFALAWVEEKIVYTNYSVN